MVWHLRILPSKSDTVNAKVSITFNGKEIAAEPRISELVNYELLRDAPLAPAQQLHLLQCPLKGLTPLFTVELPTTGWKFILDSRKGVTQWYVGIISDNRSHNVPMIHGFFIEKLVPFGWGVNNLLVTLQRAYLCLPFQNPGVPMCDGNHYIVNVLLRIKGPPNGPETKFTTHFVSAETKLMDFFDILAGERVDDRFTLVQWIWCKEAEKYDIFRCNRYSEARTKKMAFKDVGWVGKELWLLPTCQ